MTWRLFKSSRRTTNAATCLRVSLFRFDFLGRRLFPIKL